MIARCHCGFIAEGPWYKAEAAEHAAEASHVVEIFDGDEYVTGVIPYDDPGYKIR